MIDPFKRTGFPILFSGFASYFAAFYPGTDYLLVATGGSLSRLAENGTLLWANDDVGLDGVIVNSVENGVIRGEGEWDPPGGWRPFSLRLDTGQFM